MRKGLSFIAVVVLVFSVFALPMSVRAVYDDGQGRVVGIKTEACKKAAGSCEAGDWYNYSNDDGGDGETLIVAPGDTVTFRTLVWNGGELDVDPGMSMAFSNSEHLSIVDIYDSGSGYDDVDGNSNGYNINGGTIDGVIYLDSSLLTSTTSSNPEDGYIRIQIDENTPDGTVIDGSFSFNGFLIIGFNPIRPDSWGLVKKARAQEEPLITSVARLQVSNPEVVAEELPETGAAADPGAAGATGGGFPGWVFTIILTGGLAAAYLAIRRFERNKA